MTRIEEINRITAAVEGLADELNKIDLDKLHALDLVMIWQMVDMIELYKKYLDSLHKTLQ